MTRFLLELWSLASRFVNVLTGGDADTTFSAKVHIEGWRAWERAIDAFFRIFGQAAHCRKAWDDDLARARAQIERHEANIAR